MKILLTAATEMELNPVAAGLSVANNRHEVIPLVTGVGAVSTAYKLTKELCCKQYDLLVNVGIAGSFTSQYPVGSVAYVQQDCFADLGVRDEAGFTSAFSMGLLDVNKKPFTNGWLCCPYLSKLAAKSTPFTRAVTVNTITGTPARVQELVELYTPDIESMEGAAFFYAAINEGTPFVQLRSVSNKVGERDKTKWNIALALKNLTTKVDCFFAGL